MAALEADPEIGHGEGLEGGLEGVLEGALVLNSKMIEGQRDVGELRRRVDAFDPEPKVRFSLLYSHSCFSTYRCTLIFDLSNLLWNLALIACDIIAHITLIVN